MNRQLVHHICFLFTDPLFDSVSRRHGCLMASSLSFILVLSHCTGCALTSTALIANLALRSAIDRWANSHGVAIQRLQRQMLRPGVFTFEGIALGASGMQYPTTATLTLR